MKTYKIQNYGTNAQGITVTGNPHNQEPELIIIKLPFGEVEITRTTDNNYWVHVANKKDSITNEYHGQLKDLRIDSTDPDKSKYFENVEGQHLAVLVTN